MNDETPVLIAGAGPTGLNLALSLARRGVPCRLISEGQGPGEHSRAMIVQARTLEFYDQYGFADELVSEGIVMEAAHLREAAGDSSHEALTFSFKDLGEGLSPFPFALAYPQDDHERFLLRKLDELGIAVEWGARLTGFEQDSQGVRATISQDSARTINAAYLCGCDGAHSCVRRQPVSAFRAEAMSSHSMLLTSPLIAALSATSISVSESTFSRSCSRASQRHAAPDRSCPTGIVGPLRHYVRGYPPPR